MTIRLETRRLVLRPFTAADGEVVQANCARWEIACMTTRIAHPYPDGAAAAWIATHDAARDEGGEYIFAITLKHSGKQAGAEAPAIGATGLHKIAAGNLELGYWLAPEHWGQGLATEAAQAMVVYGFEKLGAEAINSGHFVDNPASGRVLQKAGLAANGIARQWSEARQDFVDAHRFLLTRESWQRARAQVKESAS